MTGRDVVLDQLAAAYREAAGQPIFPPALAALLPVVDRIANQRAAAELHKAADAAEGMHDPPAPDCVEWATWLRARAYPLAPELHGDPS